MGLALATQPRILLLDEPLAGLAVAERERIAKLIKTISAEIPILLVERDIDRVFRIADHVTVMNDGAVLVDGSVDDGATTRQCERSISAPAPPQSRRSPIEFARSDRLLGVDRINTYYGKSHILNDVSFDVRKHEIIAFPGATVPENRRC